MAGHSKWKQIKHKKAAEDARKSVAFSKYARIIALESKKSGGNVNSPGVRAAIEQARAVNMPNENIERAVKKGTEAHGENVEESIYEAYGPGGSALIISVLTDNKNRSSAEIKHLLKEAGATLATPGAALWAFEKNGRAWTPKSKIPLSHDDTTQLNTIVEELEGRDDVEGVYTNAE